jgi:hypothetical protein
MKACECPNSDGAAGVNRWIGRALAILLAINLPVGFWLAFWAPDVPPGTTWTNLQQTSTAVKWAFLLGERGSIHVVVALATGLTIVVLGLGKVFLAWRAKATG